MLKMRAPKRLADTSLPKRPEQKHRQRLCTFGVAASKLPAHSLTRRAFITASPNSSLRPCAAIKSV